MASKHRKTAQTKTPEVMLHLLDTAISNDLIADYILFDCRFANPAQITVIKYKGIDVITMIKKSSRIQYPYEGQKLNIKQIYAKKRSIATDPNIFFRLIS